MTAPLTIEIGPQAIDSSATAPIVPFSPRSFLRVDMPRHSQTVHNWQPRPHAVQSREITRGDEDYTAKQGLTG